MDIDFLFKNPEHNKMALLELEPLAPLSMVGYMPGSYYRTESTPSKYHLCGLLENLLGWHIGVKHRKQIFKQLQKHYKKEYKLNFQLNQADSGYQPLLFHLFELKDEHLYKPYITYFNDLWTQLLYRDGYSHPKGTMNLSFELIAHKNQLKDEENGSISNTDIADFFKEHSDSYPYYYSAPRVREFIDVQGSYRFKLAINGHLLAALQKSLLGNDLGYLGTSEAWVHTKIQEI